MYGDGHAGLRDHRFLPTPPATEQRKQAGAARRRRTTTLHGWCSVIGAAQALAKRTARAPSLLRRRAGRAPHDGLRAHASSVARAERGRFLTSSKMEFASVPTGNRSVCH